MKKILYFTMVLLIVLSINVNAKAKHDYRAAVLIEVNTGKILYEYNKDKVLPQASITKLMTYYTFKNYLKKNSIGEDAFITIKNDKFDIPKDGVKVGFKSGERIKIKDIINTMLIVSANDSANELEYIYNENNGDIVNLMNSTSKALGLNKSNYINTNGITQIEGNRKIYNITTAYEISKLAEVILKKYPEILKVTSRKSYTFKGKKYYNTNRLLGKLSGIDGLKTGHTNEAGYCLVATEDVTNKIGNGKNTRLLSVVFGCSTEDSRVKESTTLLKYGENNFENYKALSKEKGIKINNDYYEGGYVSGAVKKDIFIIKNKKTGITSTFEITNNLSSDISKGELIGNAYIKVGSDIFKEKLYADKNYKRKPMIIRILLSIRDFFVSLWNMLLKAFK